MSSSTSLVPTVQPQGNSLVRLDGGLNGFNQQQVTIEQVDLVQNTSRAEGAEAGKFRSKSSGQHVDFLIAIPIGAQTKRVLFPEGDFGGNPLCRSNDGKVPAPSVEKPVASVCAQCPKGPKAWVAWSAAKRKGAPKATLQALRPSCDEKLELLFLDRMTMKVVRLNVGGTSLKEVKSAIRAIQQEIQSIMDKAVIEEAEAKAAGKDFTPVTLGMYDFQLTLKPQKVSGANGVYYVLVVKQSRSSFTSPEVRERFATMYNAKVTALQEMFNRTQEDADQEYVDSQIDSAMPAPVVAGENGIAEPVIEQGSY